MATEIEERRVEVADLKVGMYVCRLDRPWEGTPFPLQGIAITTASDLRAIRANCRFVYIDARRYVGGDNLEILERTEVPEARFQTAIKYVDKANVVDEVPRAQEALENATDIVERIYQDVASGQELSVEQVEKAVRPLVASVLRSADAFLYVESLRRHDSYSFSHSISCGALAAAFGRHMGFAEQTIISLAAGGMLMDIGKTRLPEDLLEQRAKLDASDIEAVRAHVAHGLDIIARSTVIDDDVIAIVRTHHERHDGSGYPDHLAGVGIPIVGRMLGIIDAYDAMCNDRPYRPAMSRHHALREVYATRDKLFQAELVEQFQVCLGVYPTGSLVELGTGEIAVVMAQNQARRLRPRVLIVSTRDKQPLKDFRVVDLMNQVDRAGLMDVSRSLAVDEYKFDASELFLQ
ncbi:MAG: HD-GYP domain-containing protein [Dokdonella sp.]